MYHNKGKPLMRHLLVNILLVVFCLLSCSKQPDRTRDNQSNFIPASIYVPNAEPDISLIALTSQLQIKAGIEIETTLIPGGTVNYYNGWEGSDTVLLPSFEFKDGTIQECLYAYAENLKTTRWRMNVNKAGKIYNLHLYMPENNNHLAMIMDSVVSIDTDEQGFYPFDIYSSIKESLATDYPDTYDAFTFELYNRFLPAKARWNRIHFEPSSIRDPIRNIFNRALVSLDPDSIWLCVEIKLNDLVSEVQMSFTMYNSAANSFSAEELVHHIIDPSSDKTFGYLNRNDYTNKVDKSFSWYNYSFSPLMDKGLRFRLDCLMELRRRAHFDPKSAKDAVIKQGLIKLSLSNSEKDMYVLLSRLLALEIDFSDEIVNELLKMDKNQISNVLGNIPELGRFGGRYDVIWNKYLEKCTDPQIKEMIIETCARHMAFYEEMCKEKGIDVKKALKMDAWKIYY